MSIDGYIDDTSRQRLILSSPEDLDRVDEVRASCDAILVGANTIRRDNPRLLVNSAERRARRIASGLPEYPAKVTITTGGLDPALIFFTTGGEKIVYCPDSTADAIRSRLRGLATVAGLPGPVDMGLLLDDLGRRGIGRLMVEGGGTIHTQFLTHDLADEIQLVVAPFFVGQADAPRFVHSGLFPQDSGHKMTLAQVRQVGDVTLMRLLTRRVTDPLVTEKTSPGSRTTAPTSPRPG
jgi:5-amino-6-(5-phosphoribosylamino)uracil reductase